MRWIVLDTETSGLGPEDGPCEIAWQEINENLEVVHEVYSLIDPQVRISPDAAGIHGITDEQVKDAPTLDEFFHEVVGNPFTTEPVTVIAHNAQFDAKFVKPYITEMDTLCTLRLARHVYPDAPNHKLQTLRYYLGLGGDSREDSHSAMGDVMVCRSLLRAVGTELGVGLAALVPYAKLPIVVKKMPFGKHKDSLIPSLPLNYVWWLRSKADIDDDLRATLSSHFPY